MKQTYIEKSFRADSLLIIQQANEIIDEYTAEGFSLTLRQLYYQFVARDLLPNSQRSYKRLGSIINDARLAGYIDWDAIVDRTRNLKSNPHWTSPGSIIESAAYSYRRDLWAGQPYRVEVWIEKEALAGVIERPCVKLDVPYFCCRGYVSQSEQRASGVRARRNWLNNDQSTVILHLGDHDPSGVDMTRDNDDRMQLFSQCPNVTVQRIALNWDQIEQYNPPPNPAKLTDSRAQDYIQRYGRESWELDALEPRVIADLITDNVEYYMDRDLMDAAIAQQEEERELLNRLAEEYSS